MITIWKKTRGWRLPLIGFIGLAFALFSVLGRAEPPAKTPDKIPPVTPYEKSVAGIGVIEPQSELIAIGTELPGIVREVHVKVGDIVVKGAALFSLDQRDIDAQIAVLEAALESAKVQEKDSAVQYKLVANVSDKRAVAKDDLNRRKYASELGQTRVREIEAQLDQARTTKERLTVSTPIDGTILAVNVRPGEYAPVGELPEPLIRMGDVSTLHLRVEFDEENAAHVSKDEPAQAYKRGDTDHTYALSFVRFEPYVEPKTNLAVAGQRVDTRVLQVIYALPPEADDLFVGQQMDVFLKEDDTGDKS